jgi:hypothetical protein
MVQAVVIGPAQLDHLFGQFGGGGWTDDLPTVRWRR